MPNWEMETVETAGDLREQLSEALSTLRAEQDNNLLLKESLADLELALEDRGWAKVSVFDQGGGDLGPQSRKIIADNCRMGLIANPLIIRGMALRRAYIWGQGVQVYVDDDESGQDVNAVIQAFLDHPDNVVAFSGQQARDDIENKLGTDGEVFYCLPTNPLTGEVIVRLIEADEISDIVTDPQDRKRPWFYRRVWQERSLNAIGKLGNYEQREAWYPALGYNPRGIDRLNVIDGKPVLWHEPVRHVAVNRVGRMTRGMGDIYAALPWARATKEVLEAWVLLFKALARYANQVKTRGDKVQGIAAKIEASQRAAGPDAGKTYVGGNLSQLESVSKSGAMLDADGARPVAALVAAVFGVPITMLLTDPGVTGARAVAQTLDQPTELLMQGRRAVHTQAIMDIGNYVIDWAVKAGAHPLRLRGAVRYEGPREVVELANGEGRTIKVDWPDFDSTPLLERVQAISAAHDTDTMPDEVTLAELLAALKVADADKIIDANTDDEGRFIPLVNRRGDTQDRFQQRGGTIGDQQPPTEDVPE